MDPRQSARLPGVLLAMAVLSLPLTLPQIRSLRGVVDVYNWKGLTVARAWPSYTHREPTASQRKAQNLFSRVKQWQTQHSVPQVLGWKRFSVYPCQRWVLTSFPSARAAAAQDCLQLYPWPYSGQYTLDPWREISRLTIGRSDWDVQTTAAPAVMILPMPDTGPHCPLRSYTPPPKCQRPPKTRYYPQTARFAQAELLSHDPVTGWTSYHLPAMPNGFLWYVCSPDQPDKTAFLSPVWYARPNVPHHPFPYAKFRDPPT